MFKPLSHGEVRNEPLPYRHKDRRRSGELEVEISKLQKKADGLAPPTPAPPFLIEPPDERELEPV
jgi:hypothetical protein